MNNRIEENLINQFHFVNISRTSLSDKIRKWNQNFEFRTCLHHQEVVFFASACLSWCIIALMMLLITAINFAIFNSYLCNFWMAMHNNIKQQHYNIIFSSKTKCANCVFLQVSRPPRVPRQCRVTKLTFRLG